MTLFHVIFVFTLFLLAVKTDSKDENGSSLNTERVTYLDNVILSPSIFSKANMHRGIEKNGDKRKGRL